jgi:DNA-binding response OmpR family regulator
MLAGCRVLVVEDEALVAETIIELLAEAEGVPVGPVSTTCEARRLIKEGTLLHAALLDVNLGDGLVTPVLEWRPSAHAVSQLWSTRGVLSRRMSAAAIPI